MTVRRGGRVRGMRASPPPPARGRPAPASTLLALLLVVATALSSWLWLEGTKPGDLQDGAASGSGATPTVPGGIVTASVPAPTSVAPATPTPIIGNGTWKATGSPPVAVWGAGAARLEDGRVLVVGGATSSDSHSAVASASLYDPRTGRWTPATAMLQARTYPAVAVLHDGSVLVAGGSRNALPLDSAERYYPKTGTWVSAGRMHVARTHATATVLPDGRVIVVGGGTTGQPGYSATATAEIFDPATGQWADTAWMRVPRTLQTAVLLANGSVLVVGGSDVYYTNGSVYGSSEVYEPASGTWHDAAALSTPRYAASALVLPDGRVLVAGGWSGTAASAQSLSSAEIYDPAANRWSAAGRMSDGRAQFRMAALPDGRIVAAGGVSPHNTPLATVDLFDPKTLTWRATGSLPVAVYWPILVPLLDGRLLVAGGARNGSATVIWAGAALYSPPPA